MITTFDHSPASDVKTNIFPLAADGKPLVGVLPEMLKSYKWRAVQQRLCVLFDSGYMSNFSLHLTTEE